MHDWPIASYIILSKSTTAHDMRSRTTTPFPFLSATRLPLLFISTAHTLSFSIAITTTSPFRNNSSLHSSVSLCGTRGIEILSICYL